MSDSGIGDPASAGRPSSSQEAFESTTGREAEAADSAEEHVLLTYPRAKQVAEQVSPHDPTQAILPLSAGPLPWPVVVLGLSRDASTPVTHVLMGLNIAMFLALELLGGSHNAAALMIMGVNHRALVLENGHWFRLLTAAFVHFGLMHILSNMLGLWSLGRPLEYLYGRTRYTTLYLVAALGGSMASLMFAEAFSAGASGAIFGLLGLTVAFPLGAGRIVPTEIKKKLVWSSVPWLLFNLYITFSETRIDVGAHLGGLVIGLLGGLFLHSPALNPWKERKLPARILLGLTLLLCAGLLLRWAGWLVSIYSETSGAGIGGP